MAVQIIQRLISDISGADADVTVRFALEGVEYSIDLTDKEAETMRKVMERYIDRGLIVTKGRVPGHRISGKPLPNPNVQSQAERKKYLADVRAWARTKGMQIAEYGRVPTAVIDMYENRHVLEAAAIAEAAREVNSKLKSDTLEVVNGSVPVKANGTTVKTPAGVDNHAKPAPKKTVKTTPPPALFSNEEKPAAPVKRPAAKAAPVRARRTARAR